MPLRFGAVPGSGSGFADKQVQPSAGKHARVGHEIFLFGFGQFQEFFIAIEFLSLVGIDVSFAAHGIESLEVSPGPFLPLVRFNAVHAS